MTIILIGLGVLVVLVAVCAVLLRENRQQPWISEDEDDTYWEDPRCK